jgi:uncharacterized circularly permuted ATP-grasp superfamily protein/uncharacterized alpha-E superfamily protein
MQLETLGPIGVAGQSLFHAYTVPSEAYDEVFTRPGVARPPWDSILPFLETLGAEELTQRWQQAKRMLHENGVTYNVYGDPHRMTRPWELDPIPWVIPPPAWAALETALVQRVRLLNAILADVYGRAQLMAQRLLPAELVYAHSGFLRPCHGLHMPRHCYLHVYAADLGRTSDGQWYILADYTQNPAGAGYALENRIILSSVLSDLFLTSQVQRLAAFFAALQQSLIDIAPRHRDNPRIVLLTPGPYNETYFEHAYLARYLGYTLVEGADLTVRDQAVFLKTLEGLQPVDVILRRLDDTFCDPLSLQSSSLLGVAGLVQAVRAGNVAVANALGSGWLENVALLPLLPVLCRYLLGEELLLPSVPTWWCGEAEAFRYVLEHLEDLLLVAALPTGTRETIAPARLSHTERQQFVARLRALPYAYTAQQWMPLSHLPVWDGMRVQAQPTVLRVYVAATSSGYMVMPGGLARVVGAERPVASMQSERASKDTWVVSTTPIEPMSLLPPAEQPIVLRRSGYAFPSRAADNLFWMGRYAERAEGLVRLLRSTMMRLADALKPGSGAAFTLLLRALHITWDGKALQGDAPADGTASVAYTQVLLPAMFDATLPNSVRTSLDNLHHVSALVRDYMTLESWRIVTQLAENFASCPGDGQSHIGAVLDLLNHAVMILSAFSGLGSENMIRGPEWHFLDLGRRLERALHTASLLQSTLVQSRELEGPVLDALLEVGDSVITYRTRYLTRLQCAPVVDLLLTDETNPRAVIYQLVKLANHVERLPRDRAMPSLTAAERLTLRMLTTVRLAQVDLLCQVDRHGRREQLDILLQELRADLPALSDTITHHYLSHAEPTRHLAQQV